MPNRHSKSLIGVTAKTTKGYLRITAGPLRNQYVHRVVAAALIGRELTKDEEVHHLDAQKLNPHFKNLLILGEKDHSWVSNKQSYYMRCIKEPADKRVWEEFFVEKAAEQAKEIAAAKVAGKPWVSPKDGSLQREYETVGKAERDWKMRGAGE